MSIIHQEEKLSSRLVIKEFDSACESKKSSKSYLDISDIFRNLALYYSAAKDISKTTHYGDKSIEVSLRNHPNSIELSNMYQIAGDIFINHKKLHSSSTYYVNVYEIRKTISNEGGKHEASYCNSMGVL